MKKTTILMFVALLAATSIYASDDEKIVELSKNVYLKKSGDSKFALFADGSQAVTVNIYEKNGREVFSDKIDHKGFFKKVYDFSKQEPGQYVFEISTNSNSVKQEVFYSDLHLKDVSAQIGEKEPGVVILKVRHSDVPVTIELRDEEGKVIHRDKYLKDKNFVQLIDRRDYGNKALYLTVAGKKTVVSFRL